ncbi:hypothetical protein [Leisingera caerulea]|uniref:hypothetical protein n=1 Tax=Leisingera caerulea TaxID=506591 RepID=UPI0003FB73D6|nr:hypothetical protein [Leisingera caerulea]
MRIVTAVVFDGSTDRQIVNRFRMLQGRSNIDRRAPEDPDFKAFRRISGNAATLDDIETALGAALRSAADMEREAETLPCPFPEIPGRQGSVEEDWREGLRQMPSMIRREIETILDQIEDELGFRPEPKDTEARPEGAPGI